MTPDMILAAVAADPALQALRSEGRVGDIAAALSAGRIRLTEYRITELGARTLPVLPRHRFALLQALRDAAQAAPAWLVPVLTAAGVPTEDHAALADDLASGYRCLLTPPGLDVGSAQTRLMLDAIAAGVPDAAPACAAAKALAEVPDPIDHGVVSAALEGAL